MTNLLASSAVEVSLWWAIPFAVLLAAIAFMPFIHGRWWHHHYPKVAIALAIPPAIYYFAILRAPGHWVESMEEYISFIVLLGALFTVSGGILVTLNRRATPLQNTQLLVLGAVLANIFGTTGASMLLIRPFMRMNRENLKPYHIVFFIFIVSNVGGSLTPIGDPPLFLGYLSGVPFWWNLHTCGRIWVVSVGVLAAVFYVIDRIDAARTHRPFPQDAGPAVRILGLQNVLLIVGIIIAVFQRGLFEVIHAISADGIKGNVVGLVWNREVLMAAAALISRRYTSREIYERNEFSWAPIREVAILFVGIFSTMAPATQYLKAHAGELGIRTPGQFYYATGGLSAILDNAPTYKAFLDLKLGTIDPADVDRAEAVLKQMAAARTLEVPANETETVRRALQGLAAYHEQEVLGGRVTREQVEVGFLLRDPLGTLVLMAISLGAVFFGAMTYIGNGPNFMVKSIAESAGVETPGFVSYIVKYALPILLPVYVVIWLIFFY